MTAPSEFDRLEAVRELGLLETAPELRFDRLTRLAAKLFNLPVSFIGLVDDDRVWMKSLYGGSVQEHSQFPRTGSFSWEVIRNGSPLVIADAASDPRSTKHPLAGENPGIRFFAGYPLRSPDCHCVGVFALVGFEARAMEPAERALFADIAALAEAEVNAGLLFRRRREKEAERYQDLLANVSQRLRTPLNGVLVSCDLLAETTLTEEQKGFVGWLTQSARLMLKEVDGLGILAQTAPEQALLPLKVSTPPPIRVLVADDNPVNQIIAVQQLIKIGCVAEAVSSGQAALNALEQARYDVVLMDCQMPDLDGYAATEEIRRREVGTGTRVRIVAVTANVLPGERERCLAAGMDGYLPKPFHQDELLAAVRGEEPTRISRPVDPAHVQAIQNEAPGLLQRLIALFEEAGNEAIHKMTASLADGDLKALAASAHMLKGSAVNFGAQGLVQACEQIEFSGSTGQVRDYQKMLDELRHEYLRVIEALKCS